MEVTFKLLDLNNDNQISFDEILYVVKSLAKVGHLNVPVTTHCYLKFWQVRKFWLKKKMSPKISKSLKTIKNYRFFFKEKTNFQEF